MANNTIAAAVKAAFSLNVSLDGKSKEMLNTVLKRLDMATPFEFNILAREDLRVCISMVWTLRGFIVALMKVSDKPVADTSRPGDADSEEARACMPASDAEVQRMLALQDACYQHAILERHIVSLQQIVVDQEEEAGIREEDGGRIRFGTHSVWVQPHMGWDEWLLEAISKEAIDTRRRAKLELAKETVTFPHVSAQEANELFKEFIADGKVDTIALKTQEQVLDTLVELGQEVARHEQAMTALNEDLAEVEVAYTDPVRRKAHASAIKTLMAQETSQYREAINRPLWILGRKLKDNWSLLCHAGQFELLRSPLWRAEEAKIRAAAAHAAALEAQASMAEMQAMMLEQEANMGLFQMRQQMAEMQKAMAEQTKAFNALVNPPKPKAEEPKAEKPKAKAEKPKAKAKAEKPTPLVKGAQVHTTRGAATNFRPRG